MRRRWRGTATRCGSTTTTRRSTRRTWSSSGSRTRRSLRYHDPRDWDEGLGTRQERERSSPQSPVPTPQSLPCNVFVVEPADVRGDVVEMVFRSEMTRLEPVHLRRRQVRQVGLATLAGEENVILTPEDDRPRLPLAKKALPLRIQRDVRAVVVEEVEMQPSRVRPREERDVRFPRVRAHERRLRRTVHVDHLDRVSRQKTEQRLLRLL